MENKLIKSTSSIIFTLILLDGNDSFLVSFLFFFFSFSFQFFLNNNSFGLETAMQRCEGAWSLFTLHMFVGHMRTFSKYVWKEFAVSTIHHMYNVHVFLYFHRSCRAVFACSLSLSSALFM